MFDFLTEIGNFVVQRIGVEGTGILLLVAALIYIWFQHQRLKLFKEQATIYKERREAGIQEVEKRSESPETQQKPVQETMDQSIQEIVLTTQELDFAIANVSQRYARRVLIEILDRLTETSTLGHK